MKHPALPPSPSISFLLQWAQQIFSQQDIPNARLNAEILLSHVLKCRRVDLYTCLPACLPDRQVGTEDYNQPIKQSALKSFKRLVQRHEHACPIAYLTGQIEFRSLDFKVTPAVLIPRPETEFVVETCLEIIKHSLTRPTRIVEIGTGSGNIIISLAKLTGPTKIKFLATDISSKALKIARENSRLHQVNQRITFTKGSMFKAFKRFNLERKIDLLVSNPPYISQRGFNKLPLNVRKFEPIDALRAGRSGLEFIKDLITNSPDYLRPHGYLVLEIGYDQSAKVKELLEATGYFDRIRFVKDLQGIKRVVSARLTK